MALSPAFFPHKECLQATSRQALRPRYRVTAKTTLRETNRGLFLQAEEEYRILFSEQASEHLLSISGRTSSPQRRRQFCQNLLIRLFRFPYHSVSLPSVLFLLSSGGSLLAAFPYSLTKSTSCPVPSSKSGLENGLLRASVSPQRPGVFQVLLQGQALIVEAVVLVPEDGVIVPELRAGAAGLMPGAALRAEE